MIALNYTSRVLYFGFLFFSKLNGNIEILKHCKTNDWSYFSYRISLIVNLDYSLVVFLEQVSSLNKLEKGAEEPQCGERGSGIIIFLLEYMEWSECYD